MNTPPVMSITDEQIAEIEARAASIKGWNMPEAFLEPEEGALPYEWEWHVGAIDEDGNQYPLLHVNAHQYDSDDSEALARYYAACNRESILALITRLREAEVDAKRYRWLRMADWWSSPLCVIRSPKQQAKPGTDCPSRDRLDSAIDAAMGRKP